MPKSNLEILIEKATNENNVNEDWGLMLEIVDEINQTNSEKEAIRIFTRRLNERDPHIVNHTLTLLNACVTNCNRNFKLEVCSRLFIDELRNFILRKRHPKLSEKLASLVESWRNENDFKNDPALNLIPTLYIELKKNGVDFVAEQKPSSQKMKSTSSMSAEALKEEEDLARAIQLSLKESNSKAASSGASQQSQSNSLYGSLLNNAKSGSFSNGVSANTNGRVNGSNERRKVKAMYDFEAVEDNEITFKAGDILYITDETDQNWWKGTDNKGNEGLFPSNFVTSDMSYEVETYEANNSSKKVSFNNKVNVKMVENNGVENHAPVIQNFIDEKKIDDCIELLQNADPTGEIQPDTRELIELEDQCYMMGPLIDKQLQKIDQKHAILEDLNLKILEAFQIYNNLMKESISKTTANMMVPPPQSGPQMPGVSALNGSFSNMSLNNSSIPFAAAPPTFDQNSMMLANQLNSMTSNNGMVTSLPSYLNQQQPQYLSGLQQQQQQLQQLPVNNQLYLNSTQPQMPNMMMNTNLGQTYSSIPNTNLQ